MSLSNSLGLLGRKVGMMRLFTDDGDAVPVTVVDVSNNRVTQIKSQETDGYVALQVTFPGAGSGKLAREEGAVAIGRQLRSSSHPIRARRLRRATVPHRQFRQFSGQIDDSRHVISDRLWENNHSAVLVTAGFHSESRCRSTGTCPRESRFHRMRGIFYLFGLAVVALIVLQASIPP